MGRHLVIRITALFLTACSAEHAQDLAQPIMTQQGTELQGVVQQGTQTHDMDLQGFRFSGATLNGAALVNFRLENAELVAEQNQVTLRGAALVNTHLFAEWQNRNAHPPQTVVVEYQITGIVAENPIYDPTRSGNTFLYTLSQN